MPNTPEDSKLSKHGIFTLCTSLLLNVHYSTFTRNMNGMAFQAEVATLILNMFT